VPEARAGSARLTYLDQARGLAVMLMIEAHTLDAWTRAADRSTVFFGVLRIVGGFAAPVFLWLAGTSAVLAATRASTRLGTRRAAVDAVCRRGLEIFILAFLFRLQAFVASPGGPPIGLFRVDILNVMGPALVATALIWSLTAAPAGQAISFAIAAAVTALATPIVRSSPLVDTLPTWVQWYLRPAGEHTTITLLPWAGFVFGGAATGALVAAVRQQNSIKRLHQSLSAAGVLLAVIGLYTATRPPLFVQASFWTSSPAFFAVRSGILLSAVGALALAARVRPNHQREGWLSRLGRNSLFVYWIHVELVYGYATWPLHGKLPVWGTVMACGAFSMLMYRAIDLRDAAVATWRGRSRRTGGLQTA
jgi:uncharacterized membrane protein